MSSANRASVCIAWGCLCGGLPFWSTLFSALPCVSPGSSLRRKAKNNHSPPPTTTTKTTQTGGNNSAFSFLLVDHSTSENFCALSPILNCTSLLMQEPWKTVSTSAEDVTLPIHIGCLSSSSYKLPESCKVQELCGLGLPGWLLLAKGYSLCCTWKPLKSCTLTCWWRKTAVSTNVLMPR